MCYVLDVCRWNVSLRCSCQLCVTYAFGFCFCFLLMFRLTPHPPFVCTPVCLYLRLFVPPLFFLPLCDDGLLGLFSSVIRWRTTTRNLAASRPTCLRVSLMSVRVRRSAIRDCTDVWSSPQAFDLCLPRRGPFQAFTHVFNVIRTCGTRFEVYLYWREKTSIWRRLKTRRQVNFWWIIIAG